ncbi:MAG: hypothetical protein E3J72_01260 [Planctomycetota bacterium]|nr:MAG: hypothetical protein E3J72_01260 [Planctomycetota bacterium]
MNKINPIQDENIRVTAGGIFLRAPRRPFPWWGPFDAIDAFGRMWIITGLYQLACLFWIAGSQFNLINIGERGAADSILPEFGLSLLILVIMAALFIATGTGLLLRRSWCIGLLRASLVLTTLFLVVFFLFLIREQYPNTDDITVVVFFMLPVFIAWMEILSAIWMFWHEPGVRYYFEFTKTSDLESRIYRTTDRFGRVVAALGVALGLCMLCSIISSFAYGGDVMGAVVVFGFLFAIFFSIGWLLKDGANFARIALLVIVVLSLCVWILLITALVLVTISLGVNFRGRVEPSSVAIPAFSILPAIFFAVELVRYLRSNKMKAWCGIGKYTPPWQAQVDLLQEQENAQQPEITPGE